MEGIKDLCVIFMIQPWPPSGMERVILLVCSQVAVEHACTVNNFQAQMLCLPSSTIKANLGCAYMAAITQEQTDTLFSCPFCSDK